MTKAENDIQPKGLDEAVADFETLVKDSSDDETMRRVEAFSTLYGWLFPDWEESNDPRHRAFFRATGYEM